MKTRKGQSRAKNENFQRLAGKVNRKGNNRTAPETLMMSSTPSRIDKSEPSIQESLPQTSESITVGLDACRITIFRD